MSSDRPQKSSSAAPRKRRSRPRKRKGSGPKAPVVRRCIVDPDLPADQPLSPEEVADMKRHLRFVEAYRAVLRPRLNAREARMVDGSLEPEHRGACLHLLSKIDRGTILAALDREPLSSDLQVRAKFLATAAGISGDVGILLHFLEAVCQTAASDQAVRAFTRALDRIDFADLSAARMGRLLDVMQRAFPERELVGALFGLLRNPGFEAAFDASAADLDPAVAQRFVPLRAVHRAMSGAGGRQRSGAGDERDLARGLPMVLSTPPSMLEAYPLPVRERLLDAALRSGSDVALGHPGVEVLLGSLPPDGHASARHGMALARSRLARGEIDQARTVLQGLAKGPAGDDAKRLLQRLAGVIAGPLALDEPALEPAGSLQAGFHLRRVEPVWLRFSTSGARDRFAAEAALQAQACLPAVADILEQGTAKGRGAFVAIEAQGRRLDLLLADRELHLSYDEARDLAIAGVRILRALGLAGLALPDVDPRRFLVPRPGAWEQLVLADLGGVVDLGVAQAALHLRPQVGAWCHGALCFPPFRGARLRREVPRSMRGVIEAARDQGAEPAVLVQRMAR